MKILAIEEGFPPELMSSHFALEFANELAKRGNIVSVVTMFPRKHLLKNPVKLPKSKLFYWDSNYHNLKVLRVFPQFASKSSAGRALEYIASSISLFLGGLISGRNDIIHVSTPPLFVPFTACILAKIRHIPIVLRIWDVHPDALEKMGAVRNKSVLSLFRLIEKVIYREVDHITVISNSYREYLINERVPRNKITLIPNWTMPEDSHVANGGYEFRKTYGLANKFVAIFAGSLSWINDLETIIESANLLREQKNIVFVLLGDGIKKDSALQMSKSLNLSNALFVPTQPMNLYLKILSECDVSIISLCKEFNSPAFPARIPSILKCAKPIIANVPYNSDSHIFIKEANCGLWVNSGDAKSLAAAVLELSKDARKTKILGLNGQKYAEEKFSVNNCLDSYSDLLLTVKKGKGAQNA
jgi:glycosyltransferase involved in cell wall biosynthesis